MKSVRMVMPYPDPIQKFDPHSITFSDEAIMAMNLYAPLFSHDDGGNLKGVLASDLFWNGTEFEITIRSDIRTVDGFEITAKDVAASLGRILVRDSNTHASLKSFLCPNQNLRSPLSCPGIREEGNKIYLKPDDPNRREFLLSALAAIDFGIIPKKAIDWNRPDFPVVDYRNTTGPYYVADGTENGIVLRANPSHFLYSRRMLQEVHFVRGYGTQSTELFNDGLIDIIPTSNGGTVSDYERLKPSNGFHVFRTHPFFLTFLTFTQRGLIRFAAIDRLRYGYEIRKSLLPTFAAKDGKPAEQLFPVLSEGRLDESLQTKLHEVLNQLQPGTPDKPLVLGVPPQMLTSYREALRSLASVEVKALDDFAPWNQPIDKQPDAFVANTDSSFHESLSLLHYNFMTGAYGNKTEGIKWIGDYVATQDKAQRLRKLRELHFEIMAHGISVPIFIAPYLTVVRKPLSYIGSPLSGAVHLWKITVD